MYVAPNTPTLPFELDTPHPTSEELDSVIDWYRVFARESAVDDPAFAAVAAQAVACLVLLRTFAWSRPTPAQRSLRGLMRQRRRADRAARRALGPLLLALVLLVGCADAREESPPPDLSGELPAPTCEEPGEPSDVEPAAPQVGQRAWSVLREPHVTCQSMAAHPDTGLCTFLCDVSLDCGTWHAECVEPWDWCGKLGGACVRATDQLHYCEAL